MSVAKKGRFWVAVFVVLSVIAVGGFIVLRNYNIHIEKKMRAAIGEFNETSKPPEPATFNPAADKKIKESN